MKIEDFMVTKKPEKEKETWEVTAPEDLQVESRVTRRCRGRRQYPVLAAQTSKIGTNILEL